MRYLPLFFATSILGTHSRWIDSRIVVNAEFLFETAPFAMRMRRVESVFMNYPVGAGAGVARHHAALPHPSTLTS